MNIDECLDEIAHVRSRDTFYKVNVINNRYSKKKDSYKHFYVKVKVMKTPLASIDVTVPLGNEQEVWQQYKTLDPDKLHDLVRDEVENRTKSIITRLLTVR
jgi:hypothetical protein